MKLLLQLVGITLFVFLIVPLYEKDIVAGILTVIGGILCLGFYGTISAIEKQKK